MFGSGVHKKRVAESATLFSPFLIFYSRYARPYIIVVLLSFLAVFYYYLWMIKGHTRYIICYLVCAIVSPYFNLFSTAVVLGPLIYTLLLMLMRRIRAKKPEINICIDFKKLLMVIIITIIGISIWLIPTFDSLNILANKINRGTIGLNTIAGVLNNICGVGNDILSMVCFSLIPIGLYIAYRKDRLFGSYTAFLVLLNIVLIMVIRPVGVHYPMVFSRYFIASIPLCLLAASIAIDEIANRVETLKILKGINIKYILHAIIVIMMLLLFIIGPLLVVYKYPNNFTNHVDFQCDYKHTLIKNADKIYGDIPRFYRELKNDDGTDKIIEAPFLSMWIIHNYHIYQIIHEKEVMIGHDNISYLSPPRIVMNKNINFECFVNIDTKQSIKKNGAEYIIVHKDVAMERDYLIDKIIKKTQLSDEVPSVVELIDPVYILYSKHHAKALIAKLNKMFGNHYYEDEWITVFRVINRK